jgi:hypothetical protein
MTDSVFTGSVVVVGEVAAGRFDESVLPELPAVPDAGGEGEDALADACPDSFWAVAAVQSERELALGGQVMGRSLASGALAFALTGSTARGCRTAISDLDYHVVGPRPDVSDLPGEVDVYASIGDQLWTKLRNGDDFIQWTWLHPL